MAPQRREALSTIASNTGCASAGDRRIMRSTSLVAACCSSASLCSRASRSALVSSTVITELRERVIFGVLGGLDVFFAFLPNFCRLIACPEAKLRHRIGSAYLLEGGCPLWVKSRLMQCSNACPLYPQ